MDILFLSVACVMGVKWLLQGSVFRADFLIFPLCTCDVVLGVQWLTDLGDIIFNIKQMTMKFAYEGKTLCLQGNIPKIKGVESEALTNIKQEEIQLFMIKVTPK